MTRVLTAEELASMELAAAQLQCEFDELNTLRRAAGYKTYVERRADRFQPVLDAIHEMHPGYTVTQMTFTMNNNGAQSDPLTILNWLIRSARQSFL